MSNDMPTQDEMILCLCSLIDLLLKEIKRLRVLLGEIDDAG